MYYVFWQRDYDLYGMEEFIDENKVKEFLEKLGLGGPDNCRATVIRGEKLTIVPVQSRCSLSPRSNCDGEGQRKGSPMRYWKPKKISTAPLVSIVATAYFGKELRQVQACNAFMASLEAQTYQHYELLLVHDGPIDTGLYDRAYQCGYDKVLNMTSETEIRRGEFGHPNRAEWVKEATGQYIGITNADNLYAPVYLESLLDLLVNHKADFAYCNMIHSHKLWKPLDVKPKRGKIDIGGWLARADLVKSTKWRSMSFNGDGVFIEDLVARCKRVEKVPYFLFMHN